MTGALPRINQSTGFKTKDKLSIVLVCFFTTCVANIMVREAGSAQDSKFLRFKDQQIGVIDSTSFTKLDLHREIHLCPCETLNPAGTNKGTLSRDTELIGWAILIEISKACSLRDQVRSVQQAGYNHLILFDSSIDDKTLPLTRKELKSTSAELVEVLGQLAISFISSENAHKLMYMDDRYEIQIFDNKKYNPVTPKWEWTRIRIFFGIVLIILISYISYLIWEFGKGIAKNRPKPNSETTAFQYRQPIMPNPEPNVQRGEDAVHTRTESLELESNSESDRDEVPFVDNLPAAAAEGPPETENVVQIPTDLESDNAVALQRILEYFNDANERQQEEMLLGQIHDHLSTGKTLREEDLVNRDSQECYICYGKIKVGDTVPSQSHGCFDLNFLHLTCLENCLKETANTVGTLRCPNCRQDI